MKFHLTIGCLASMLCGCIEPTREVRQVEILSDPPGARILIDGDYWGDAPKTLTIWWYESICSPPTWSKWVTAIPNGPGQYEQSQLIWPAKMPQRILFDMYLHRVNNHRLDIHLDDL